MQPVLLQNVFDSYGIRMLAPAALTFGRGMVQQMREARLLHHPSPLWRGEAA